MLHNRPRHNFQTIGWFNDLNMRGRLDLDPPYQRRSVWNQDYKDYFIDTVLLGYPTAAIFLYEKYDADGSVTYSVIDGKQRLTTLLDFVDSVFPVSDEAQITKYRGLYWKEFEDEVKREFWAYEFLIEYISTTEEAVINNIFDRINRNVAKLTRQELRHARFDGEFISAAEEFTRWMTDVFPKGFPQIATPSKRQMKDVELVANLLLLLEQGPRSLSQDSLDKAFSDRDLAWENKDELLSQARDIVRAVNQILKADPNLVRSRLRNQADFYSAFGAIGEIGSSLIDPKEASLKISKFLQKVSDEGSESSDKQALEYFEAARSASNDQGPRSKRIEVLKEVFSRPKAKRKVKPIPAKKRSRSK
ncbi:MAG: hypothetical protein ACI8UO_004195 [Verrucomicrobiales bacterium]|jgi:hypothetical protein